MFVTDSLYDDGDSGHSGAARFTTLANLLRRLQQHVTDPRDFLALSSVLVGILATIDSPDAVSNVVDRVAECVAPRSASTGGDGDSDSTSALLTRHSPLGLFVRKFLLAVNRLLFDGISRLFDDVVQYVARFQEDEARARAAVAAAGEQLVRDDADAMSDDNISDGGSDTRSRDEVSVDDGDVQEASLHSESSRQSVGFLWRGGADSLVLSPIPTRVAGGASLMGFVPNALSSSPSSAASPPPPHRGTSSLPTPTVSTEPLDVSVWTHDQLSYILHDMLRTIERERMASGNVRADDDVVEEQLRHVTQSDTSDPSVLFVKYLDFLHRRDYQGALDSLHQYHDIALSSAQMGTLSNAEAGDGSGSAVAGGAGSSGGSLHFHGTGIQYAALNLAGLHIMFDHHEAAYDSVQEAIRVAQHYGDHICVAFALSWLIRVYLKLGRSKEHVLGLLQSCIDRAKELRLPSLETLVSLSQIESDLLRGPSADQFSATDHHAAAFLSAVYAARAPSPRPLDLWHRLQEAVRSVNAVSSTLSVGSTGSGASSRGAFGGIMQPQLAAAQQGNAIVQVEQSESGLRWLKSVDGVLDHTWRLSGKVSLASAVGWQVLGHRTLGALFDRVHLLCFQDAASACEIALSVCSLAACQLGDEYVGDANVYARGLSFLVDTIDESAGGELIYHVPIQRKLHGLFFVWALRSGQLLRAKVHSDMLLELSLAHKDLPAHIEALMSKAELLHETGDCSGSVSLLDAVLKTCVGNELTYLQARVLLVTAHVLQDAARAEAPFSPMNAVLEVIRICELQQYDLLLAEAHVVLAELFVSMGTVDRAEALIEDQMPLVMEHGDVNLRGECMLVLAKCALASTSDTRGTQVDGNSSCHQALELLQRSYDMFTASQNLKRLKEVSYLRAMVANHLSVQPFSTEASEKSWFMDLRESAAHDFLAVETRLEQAKLKPIEPFFDFEFTDHIRRIVNHRMPGK